MYGVEEKDKERLDLRFKNFCKKNSIIIHDNMGNYTLSNIIGEEIIDVEEKKLPQEMIVIINGFQGMYLQQAVKMVREVLGSKPILASTTPNSVRMTVEELINHLVEEREFYKKK